MRSAHRARRPLAGIVSGSVSSEAVETPILRAYHHAPRADGGGGGDGVAGVELPLLGARRQIERVQLPVARADEDAVASHRGRRIHPGAAHELPDALAAVGV